MRASQSSDYVAVVVATGDRYIYLATNAVTSLLRNTSADIHLITSETSGVLEGVLSKSNRVHFFSIGDYETSDYYRAVSYSKHVWFTHFLEHIHDGQRVLFLDADAMVSIDPWTDQMKFDICLTSKSSGHKLNTGVIMARKNESTAAFFRQYLAKLEASLSSDKKSQHEKYFNMYGGIDQGVMVETLAELYGKQKINSAMTTFSFLEGAGPNFPSVAFVNAATFNCTDLEKVEPGATRVIHLKAGHRSAVEKKGKFSRLKTDSPENANHIFTTFQAEGARFLESQMDGTFFLNVNEDELPREFFRAFFSEVARMPLMDLYFKGRQVGVLSSTPDNLATKTRITRGLAREKVLTYHNILETDSCLIWQPLKGHNYREASERFCLAEIDKLAAFFDLVLHFTIVIREGRPTVVAGHCEDRTAKLGCILVVLPTWRDKFSRQRTQVIYREFLDAKWFGRVVKIMPGWIRDPLSSLRPRR